MTKSRSQNQTSSAKVAAFVKWFTSRAREIHNAIEPGPFPASLASEISREVQKVHPKLRWEIGPLEDELFFAFGCGGNADLLEVGKDIVSQLAPISGWTFLPAKPRKQAARRIIVRSTAGERTVDFDQWQFALKDAENGLVTVLLRPRPKTDLEGDELEGLGWMIVDFELGEELVIEHLASIEMVSSFDVPAEPIARLFQSIAARS